MAIPSEHDDITCQQRAAGDVGAPVVRRWQLFAVWLARAITVK